MLVKVNIHKFLNIFFGLYHFWSSCTLMGVSLVLRLAKVKHIGHLLIFKWMKTRTGANHVTSTFVVGSSWYNEYPLLLYSGHFKKNQVRIRNFLIQIMTKLNIQGAPDLRLFPKFDICFDFALTTMWCVCSIGWYYVIRFYVVF